MSRAIENRNKKHDYEIMLKDSPDYFAVENAKIVFETGMVRFICFDKDLKYKEDIWYPMINVFRIKKYT